MRALHLMVVAAASAAGCKDNKQTPPPAPTVASKVAATEPPAIAPTPSPIAAGPCVGKWTFKLATWGKFKGKGPCPSTEDLNLERTFLVARDGAGYAARRLSGQQDLKLEIKSSSADGCSIIISDHYNERFISTSTDYALIVAGGNVTASGNYKESDHSREDIQECSRPFTTTATREPLAPADLAFDPTVIAKEVAELWDGERALTFKEFCSELPVMKTALPRKAKVMVQVDASGGIAKLVIDGVDQPLETGCNFPMALEQAEPIALTNRSGVPQSATFELALR